MAPRRCRDGSLGPAAEQVLVGRAANPLGVNRWSPVAPVAALVLALAVGAGPTGAQEADPPWSVDEKLLEQALDCPDTFVHPDREPVLLVHGTFTGGQEQFGWNYLLLLEERGFDACVVTYPDRGLGDLQVSAEYVAHAILAIHERTGQKVDVMGHSQGGLLPRWAIKYWPSVRAVVDDAVLVAPPSHGTDMAGSGSSPLPMPAAFFQMARGSQFIAALNVGEQAPGGVSWSVLFTDHDLLVRPVEPEPTAALDWGEEGPNLRNVRIQDVCPGRVVDHLTIGTTDRLSQELVLDALANPGPVDPARLGPPDALCALPDQYLAPEQLGVILGQMERSFGGGFPDFHTVDAEPPLKPYAAAALAEASEQPASPDPAPQPPAPAPAPAGPEPGTTPGDPPVPEGALASTMVDGSTLPATGGAVPVALATAALLAGLALRGAIGRGSA
jgi:triacylglycerol lipase